MKIIFTALCKLKLHRCVWCRLRVMIYAKENGKGHGVSEEFGPFERPLRATIAKGRPKHSLLHP